jgi:hypothetical protein
VEGIEPTAKQVTVAGTQTAGLLFGGDTTSWWRLAATEEYNGSTWTSWNIIQDGRFDRTGCWNSNSCFRCWRFYRCKCCSSTVQLKNMMDQLGQAGGSLPVSIEEHAGSGTQTAGVSYGGTTAPPWW